MATITSRVSLGYDPWMRIGHYMHDIWAPGGVSSYIARLSKVQRDRGDQVVFFDSAANQSADVVKISDGESLARAAERLHLDVLHIHLVPPGGYSDNFPAVRTVHGHQPYCPSGAQYLSRPALPCERKQGVLPCTWGHLIDRCGSARPSKLLDDFRRTRNEHRFPDRMIFLANSRFVAARLLRDGYAAPQVRVLLYPAPEARLPAGHSNGSGSPPGREASFLFMGRLTPSKGVIWLLHALARTPDTISLDIAGRGPQEPELRRHVGELRLERRVRFHGWLPDGRVAELCEQTRAVVVPSLWHEPAGLVAIEAATYGTAVVASRVGGLPEMVDHESTGLVVPPDDTPGLAHALEMLAADPALAATFGDNGRTRAAELFALETHLAGLDAAYREAMLVG